MKGVGEGVAGYVTPKVAVGAVVHNDAGEILLVQRADSGIWLYPTGWADVGYSASEIAVKEVKEETGIDCTPVRLIALLDGLRLGFTSVPLYSLVFLCRATGGELDGPPARDPRRRVVRPRRHARAARRRRPVAGARQPGDRRRGRRRPLRRAPRAPLGRVVPASRRRAGASQAGVGRRGHVRRRQPAGWDAGPRRSGRSSSRRWPACASLVAWPTTGLASFSSLVRCHRPGSTWSRRTRPPRATRLLRAASTR